MTQASARHILVETDAECVKLKLEIENGLAFEQAAKDNSKCPSGAEGGGLGTFGRGQMVPEFEEVVFEAPIGVVQGPVKTQFGFHLIEVTDRQE